MDFYVYLHRRKSDNVVFYVGKGTGRRAKIRNGRNNHWNNIVNKHGFVIEIVQTGMQEWWALEMEENLIAFYGRENLCNGTNGGEGITGYKHSDETKLIISQKGRGLTRSEETRKRMVEAQKGRQINLVDCSNGMRFLSCGKAEKWLKENGKPKATRQAIGKAARKVVPSAYGFKWSFVDR